MSLSKLYRPDIDGLRAVAVILVIIFHGFPKVLPGGFVGVDVFFVISGFLISGIILDTIHSRGHLNYFDFYARRARRLFPALALVLLSTIGIGALMLFNDEFKQLIKHIWSGIFFVSNITLYREVDYFDATSTTKPLLHLWSLSVEEQFYLLWPLILVLLSKVKWNLRHAILFLGMMSFVLNVYFLKKNPSAVFYMPVFRFWELALGAYLAVIVRENAPLWFIPAKFVDLCSATGLSLILFAAVTFQEKTPFPGWLGLLPVLGACALIASGPRSWIARKILSNKFAVFVGLISYPWYLWHWPLISFAHIGAAERLGYSKNIVLAFAILISFVLAFLTYQLIELRVRRSPSPRFAISLFILVIGIGVTGSILSTRGWTSLNHISLDAFSWDNNSLLSMPSCLKRYDLSEELRPYCTEYRPEKALSILVIGDSYANTWMPGIAKANPETGILGMASGGCLFFDQVETFSSLDDLPHQRLCSATMSRAFEIVRNNPSLHTVILASRVTKVISDLGVDRELSSIVVPGTNNSEIYEAALRRTLTELTIELKKKVIYVHEVAAMGFNPKNCVRLSRDLNCRVKRTEVDEAQRAYRLITARVLKEFPAVDVLDPLSVLCDEKWCRATYSGRMLYRDEGHLNVKGSEYIWGRMSPVTR